MNTEQKHKYRKQIRAQRNMLTPDEVKVRSVRIMQRIHQLPEYKK